MRKNPLDIHDLTTEQLKNYVNALPNEESNDGNSDFDTACFLVNCLNHKNKDVSFEANKHLINIISGKAKYRKIQAEDAHSLVLSVVKYGSVDLVENFITKFKKAFEVLSVKEIKEKQKYRMSYKEEASGQYNKDFIMMYKKYNIYNLSRISNAINSEIEKLNTAHKLITPMYEALKAEYNKEVIKVEQSSMPTDNKTATLEGIKREFDTIEEMYNKNITTKERLSKIHSIVLEAENSLGVTEDKPDHIEFINKEDFVEKLTPEQEKIALLSADLAKMQELILKTQNITTEKASEVK